MSDLTDVEKNYNDPKETPLSATQMLIVLRREFDETLKNMNKKDCINFLTRWKEECQTLNK